MEGHERAEGRDRCCEGPLLGEAIRVQPTAAMTTSGANHGSRSSVPVGIGMSGSAMNA
jgi:hypothetical protein